MAEAADVVVVGGGIRGVTIAYFLARAGIDVAVVERGFLGAGRPARTPVSSTSRRRSPPTTPP